MTMLITDHLQQVLKKTCKELGLETEDIHLEHPADQSHGDYATNIAMVLAKNAGKNPCDLAQEMVTVLEKETQKNNALVARVEIAGPGFINFFLHDTFFQKNIQDILEQGDNFGKNNFFQNRKVITEFTDPNPFKLLHIGHVMSNTIGESLSRIFQFSGGDVRWSNYQGDVGMHVAKALWGMYDLGGKEQLSEQATLTEKVTFLGKAYAHGATAYKNGEHVKDMQALNKKIYERTDREVNTLYDWGREVSLAYFETQYKRLGTYHNLAGEKAFHIYNFESHVAEFGVEVVRAGLEQGIFKESDGAVVFDGEPFGLHKRVFINSLGLPTYEAKELGLAKVKYDQFPYDFSYIITGNEINEYFKVLLKAMSFTFPDLAQKTTHIGHGMMKLTTGKMSSRTGDVIVAEDLLDGMEEKVRERMGDNAESALVNAIAVAAVKFAILKQDTTRDIIFDPETSLSFEGDSGPYLQYTFARIQSLLEKAKQQALEISMEARPETVTDLEKYIYRFPEMVESSRHDNAPHHVAQFLLDLAHRFNSWYANTKILDAENPHRGYNLALAQAVGQVIKNGLWLLGIEAPEKM